jgi:hypothetical protein
MPVSINERSSPSPAAVALPRRRRPGYNSSYSRDHIAQRRFDWSMEKAADKGHFDRRRSWEIRGLKHLIAGVMERLGICA